MYVIMIFQILSREMSMLIFWVVTPCGLNVDTKVSEEHTASSTLNMEAVCSSQTLVPTYMSIPRYNPEDHL
jgi:hypothetical protein